MSKKISTFLITAVLAAALSGCAGAGQEGSITGTEANLQNSKENIPEPKAPPEIKDVELVVWGAEEDEALLNQIFESFKDEYQGQANFQITFAAQSESGCKDALMADLEAGADVFAFADDQLNTLVAAGALERQTTVISFIIINSISIRKILKPSTACCRLRRKTEKRLPWTGLPHGMFTLFSVIQAWKSD